MNFADDDLEEEWDRRHFRFGNDTKQLLDRTYHDPRVPIEHRLVIGHALGYGDDETNPAPGAEPPTEVVLTHLEAVATTVLARIETALDDLRAPRAATTDS